MLTASIRLLSASSGRNRLATHSGPKLASSTQMAVTQAVNSDEELAWYSTKHFPGGL